MGVREAGVGEKIRLGRSTLGVLIQSTSSEKEGLLWQVRREAKQARPCMKSLKHSGVRKGNKGKLNKWPRAARFLK